MNKPRRFTPAIVIDGAVPKIKNIESYAGSQAHERRLARAFWAIGEELSIDAMDVEQIETPDGQRLVRVVLIHDGAEVGGYLMALH